MKEKYLICVLFQMAVLVMECLAVPNITSPNEQVFEKQDTIINKEPKFPYASLKRITSQNQEFTIFSPDDEIEVMVNAEVNQLSYSISYGTKSIIESSIIDLTLSTIGNLANGLELIEVSTHSVDEILELKIGERTNFRNQYNESIFSFSRGGKLDFKLLFRVYNEGVAYRFSFPENENYSSLIINNEIVQYRFSDNLTAFIEPYNERGYTPVSTQNSFSRTLIPLTLTNNDLSVCINEADNDNYARIGLKGFGGNKLQSFFLANNKSLALPFSCPWRYMVIGATPIELIQNKEMLHGLSPQTNEKIDWDWVKPGKVFRSMELTTEGGKKSIDFCKKMKMQYMMFDAGWYGLGYGQSKEKDRNSDPTDVIDAIDMEEVCAYAASKGIGIILYINKVGWDFYDNNKMLDLYESWGVKGIKLGFMDGYSAAGVQKIYNIIEEAAKRHIFVNVHDEFRYAGTTFKYPNLLTAEGVKGNESVRNTGDHTTLLPFTRFLSGAADYTICYKGNDPNYNKPSTLGTTRGHQLALSIMFYSPLQHLFWYAIPGIYHVPVEIELFKEIPTVWDDFHVPSAEMGDFVSIARKKNEKWYLATICDNTARDITVPLDFLDPEKEYRVTIYSDANLNTITKVRTNLNNLRETGQLTGSGLNISLRASGGAVCVFDPDLDNSISTKEADFNFRVFPNPTSGLIKIQTSAQLSKADIAVVSMDGRIVLKKENMMLFNENVLDLSNLTDGCYLVVIKSGGIVETHKLIKFKH